MHIYYQKTATGELQNKNVWQVSSLFQLVIAILKVEKPQGNNVIDNDSLNLSFSRFRQYWVYLFSMWWIETIKLCLSTHYTTIFVATPHIDL